MAAYETRKWEHLSPRVKYFKGWTAARRKKNASGEKLVRNPGDTIDQHFNDVNVLLISSLQTQYLTCLI